MSNVQEIDKLNFFQMALMIRKQKIDKRNLLSLKLKEQIGI